MTVHAGATLDRFPGYKYQSSLHFGEMSFRNPRPRAGTLGKLKRAAKSALRVSLVAPRDAMLDERGVMLVDAVRPGLDWVRSAAEALDAIAIVLPTGREVTPGQRDRARLEAYIDALGRTSGRAIVWSPSGLWERDTAARFAEKLGVVLGFDPIEDEAPEGVLGYARLRAIGVRSRISTGILVASLEKVLSAGYGTAYVAIDSQTSFRDAKSLQALAVGAVHESDDDEADDDEFSFDDDE